MTNTAKSLMPGRNLAAEQAFLEYLSELRRFGSVVDVGCGVGSWLRVARELGVTEIRGYDRPGLPLASRGLGEQEFRAADLLQPLAMERTFDLAICLELAQFLPAAASGPLVKSLCAAADWVLFGAALPFQGGAEHVHEDWMEYWAGLFRGNGFLCYDILRERFWNEREIPFYLRQNACLFVKHGTEAPLKSRRLEASLYPPSLIHPELYLRARSWMANNRDGRTDSREFEAEISTFYQNAGPLSAVDAI